MNHLQRLIYLCHKKNELNRKRRRFYYIWRHLSGNAYNHTEKKPKHKSFTIKSAWAGYEQAKRDMKAMTKEMRDMRVECGVRFIWNDGGLITHIRSHDWEAKQKSFKRYHEAEIFEMTLFKSETT